MSEGTERRLAAIVVADVAGYSRLMGADEIGTLAVLRAHCVELIDPLIAKHGGRIESGQASPSPVRRSSARRVSSLPGSGCRIVVEAKDGYSDGRNRLSPGGYRFIGRAPTWAF